MHRWRDSPTSGGSGEEKQSCRNPADLLRQGYSVFWEELDQAFDSCTDQPHTASVRKQSLFPLASKLCKHLERC